MTDIKSLTIGQVQEIQSLFAPLHTQPNSQSTSPSRGLNGMIGKKVIVRTYSAGCWFGTLAEKDGAEVVLSNARRMWRWKAKAGISLSACAMYGVDADESKIVDAVPSVWLEAIEVVPCSAVSIASLESAPNVAAQ